MALIVIYDEGASPEKVLEVLPSANTPEYDFRTDVLVNPDLSSVQGIVPRRYWKHVAGSVVEFTQAEKDAQDAAEAAAEDLAVRTEAKGQYDGQTTEGLAKRAFADVVMREINLLRTWTRDLQTNMAAANNNVAGVKDAVSTLPTLADRTLAQLKTSIQSTIDGGTVDE